LRDQGTRVLGPVLELQLRAAPGGLLEYPPRGGGSRAGQHPL